MIGIINYEMGNLGSVQNAFDSLYIDAKVISSPKEISECSKLVLPGVGSFKQAMLNLERQGWAGELKKIQGSMPIMGICLGMQLFFESSHEGGFSEGLGLIEGQVNKFDISENLKLPHVGWNTLIAKKTNIMTKGISSEIDVYFVHSYICMPKRIEDILFTSNYGSEFVAAVSKDNIYGFQFHPEKSQPIGLKLLNNFKKLK